MAMIKRYEDRLHGVLSCYDRNVITGTLPGACHAQGMTGFLYAHGIRIFHYPQFVARCDSTAGSGTGAVGGGEHRTHHQSTHSQGRRGGQVAQAARHSSRIKPNSRVSAETGSTPT